MSGSVKNSRVAVEQRNTIAPQMRDYDEIGMRQEWVPHLMYFHPRNVALNSVSTDEFGFRNTTGAKPNAPTALLVGGSSVFGIGATSDGKTIPSLLNASTKYNWRNLGGRAFNSTQESILVHLANVKKIDGPIVVMSGINNLTRTLMSGSFSPMFGAFFHQGLFEQQMKSAAVGNRALTRMLIEGLRAKFGLGKKSDAVAPKIQSAESKAESYRAMLSVFERDCEYINMLAKHNKTTTAFVLQPFAQFVKKSFTSQELRLFELLDQEAESFSRVLAELSEKQQQYSTDLQRICGQVGVKFVDLNSAPELQQPDWLFVDRVHLTDAGYSVVAKLLVRDLSL